MVKLKFALSRASFECCHARTWTNHHFNTLHLHLKRCSSLSVCNSVRLFGACGHRLVVDGLRLTATKESIKVIGSTRKHTTTHTHADAATRHKTQDTHTHWSLDGKMLRGKNLHRSKIKIRRSSSKKLNNSTPQTPDIRRLRHSGFSYYFWSH